MKSETAFIATVPTKSVQKSAFSRNAGLIIAFSVIFRAVTVGDPGYKTGKTLETALRTRVAWSCVGIPLNNQLSDLEKQAEIAIVRDRRVDPHLPVTMTATSAQRIQVLRNIVLRIPEAAFSLTDALAYVGPASSANRLPILMGRNNDQAYLLRMKLEAAAFRKLTTKIDASWDPLSEPRQILLKSAREAGVTVSNPEFVPHDVWGEQQLPMMSFAEIATLVLNQFDMTFEFSIDSTNVLIVPVNPTEVFEYRHIVGSKLKSAVSSEWQSRLPSLQVKWTGAKALVAATLDEHGQLHDVITETTFAESPSESSGSVESIRTTRFQLKAERLSVGELIEYFRTNKILIEVKDPNSPATKAALGQIVQPNEITEKKAGSEFFPLIFNQHFIRVDVYDDRIILSNE